MRLMFSSAMMCLVVLGACGGDDGGSDPLDVALGETTLVVVSNPTINDVNEPGVADPGD